VARPAAGPDAVPDAASGRRSLSDLPGWADDDLDDALMAFLRTPMNPLAAAARDADDAADFLAAHFTPDEALAGHFTGYYEPELDGATAPSGAFPVPLHTLPPDGCDHPRAGIDAHLRGHEVVWLRDDVDRFFAQVQGSVRVRLADGTVLRLGHDGKNGHPYRSIGKLLVERGVFGPDITADALTAWLRADPARGRAVMNENPCYVFFRRLDTDLDLGPDVTVGCPATPGRTLAVDPDHLPLGTPVWIDVDGLARLCIAQDTGSAIKGPGRADLFFGTGDAAGRAAGRLNHAGRFVPLRRR
jgi:membrane-bound lytic murein transglycosylase A